MPGFSWPSPGSRAIPPSPVVAPARLLRPTPGKPAALAATPAKHKPRPLPPIAFFIAKGDPHACGRDCDEWIAAEGTFDADAPRRLRAVLNRLGNRKLRIFFHSPGGSGVAALEVGRLLRRRGMTAGVAWTVPQGCDARQWREEACDKLKRSGRDLAAQLDSDHTMCNSACVFALVGAAVREVGPGVGLGVHSASIRFF